MQSEWWIECGANLPNGKFMRNVIIRENEVTRFRFKHDNRGVFATAYKYDCPQISEANLIGDFYLDLDGTELCGVLNDALIVMHYMHKKLGIEPEQVLIYFSGQKGIHIVVPKEVFGISPSKDLHRAFKLLAEDIKSYTKHGTIDLKIYDARRLFRLPNSLHPKTGLYKVPITYSEVKALLAGEIDITTLAKEPRVIQRSKAKMIPMAQLTFHEYIKQINTKKVVYSKPLKPLAFTPPCIEALIKQSVPQGQRNNTAAALASFFRQQGLNKEESKHRMNEWNIKCCDPPMPDYEVEATLESVYRGEYKMGCSWMNTISDCDKANCKLYRRK